MDGYFDDGTNAVCPQCDAKCLTCSGSGTNCLTCNTTIRTFTVIGSGGRCVCNTGTR